MRFSISALTLAALVTGTAYCQTTQTIHGTVSDVACGAHHGMKNMTAAECTRVCVKGGSDFALVSDGKVYTLKGDKAAMDKFAGRDVTVKGKVDGMVIMVDSIS